METRYANAYVLNVVADKPGIIHRFTQYLAGKDIFVTTNRLRLTGSRGGRDRRGDGDGPSRWA